MARFTDELVGFNPYIAQIPVDDYVRVGMIKQQQYNEGVQRVQSYIDSVAGIDVVKPEQKEYLQTRVSQLQGEVGKIVSEDFSNQQIVNSVGNLTGKIAGDPIIQNAVYSTQKYRQGLAAMKDANDKGQGSPSNEYVFQKQVQDWLGDHDVKSTFNGEYEKYTDTKKPILEAINALKPGANVTDIPYETDSQGNYLVDSRGNRKIAYATLREKLEGVPEERVRMAIEASITPQMKRQFEIDGMYEYRGLDKFGLKKVADASYNNRFGKINDIVQGLTTQLNTANNSDAQKEAIQAKLKQYDMAAKDLQNEYRRDMEYLDKNPESYKGDLHYQDEMAKYSLGYAWSKHSLTYEKNPIFDGVMKENQQRLNWAKLGEISEYHKGLLGIREQELEMKKLMYQMKLKMSGGLGLDAPIFGPIDQEKLESISLSTITNEVDNMSKDLDQQKLRMISQLEGGGAWITNNDGQLMYKDANAKDAAEAAIKTMKESYDKDPTSVSPAAQTFFRNQSITDGVVKNFQDVADKIVKNADARFPTAPLSSNLTSLVIARGDNKYTLNPQEIVDLAFKYSKYQKEHPRPTAFGPTGMEYPQEKNSTEYNNFINSLSPKEREVVKMYDAHEDGKVDTIFQRAIGNVNSMASHKLAADRANYIQTEARRAYTQQQQQTNPIMAYKPELAMRAKSLFVQLLNDQKAANKENPNPLFNESDISTMLDDKNLAKTTYALHTNPDGTQSIRFSNTSVSDKPREMDITPQQAETLFGSYVNEFKPIQQAINLSKYNGVGATTDVRGLGRESAYNIPTSPQLQNYSVKYHVEEPYNGQYQVKLYIYDKGKKAWLPETYVDLDGRMLTPEQVTSAINHLTDSEIDRLKKQKPSKPSAPASYAPPTYTPDPYVDKQGINMEDAENQDEQDNTDNEEQE